MAMREAHPQPLAFGATAVAAGHIGRGPGFVDEDELGRIKVQLIIEPLLALFQDVRTDLLYRVASLFLRVWPCRTRNRCKADLLMVMPWAESASRSSNKVPSRCSASHAMIASPWASVFREFRSPPRGPRSHVALAKLQISPAADACGTHAEPFSSFSVGRTSGNSSKHANSQIDRESF